MPTKNSIKTYAENSFYHIYNRGVEKRNIFTDEQDFKVFLSYLKTYLSPKDTISLQKLLCSPESSMQEKNMALQQLSLRNFSDEIELVAYCLMPNHFHLLIKQKNASGINRFMHALTTRYTIYFNKRYQRVGSLLQGVYKAVLLENDEQLLHLSRYIHKNPFTMLKIPVSKINEVKWPFSLPDYLYKRNTPWINTKYILDYFNKSKPKSDYLNFIDSNLDFDYVATLALDYDDEG